MVRLGELRRQAAAELCSRGNESPKADVDVLLNGILGFGKSDIILGDREIDEEGEEKFRKALERVKKGEPVRYVTGVCEFMSLDFKVNRHTLIPRADTEILVETVIDMCRDNEEISILDIGCGSGCIAISLAYYLPSTRVTAVDISEGALETAAENAERYGVKDEIDFVKCDIMREFPEGENGGFDIIVSNPPYIPPQDIENLAPKVRDFEPRTALDGGEDGLKFYRRITEAAKLKKGGILAFEVGIGQSAAVTEMMTARFENIEKIKDLSGTERVIIGTLK